MCTASKAVITLSRHTLRDGSASSEVAPDRASFKANSMSRVLVVDANHCPLAPCLPRRARLLLNSGKAAVLRRYPFTIILKQSYPTASPRPVRLKLDPGSKTTGITVVTEATGEVVCWRHWWLVCLFLILAQLNADNSVPR